MQDMSALDASSQYHTSGIMGKAAQFIWIRQYDSDLWDNGSSAIIDIEVVYVDIPNKDLLRSWKYQEESLSVTKTLTYRWARRETGLDKLSHFKWSHSDDTDSGSQRHQKRPWWPHAKGPEFPHPLSMEENAHLVVRLKIKNCSYNVYYGIHACRWSGART